MKVKIFTTLLILALTLSATAQPRRVRIGGPDEDIAKHWPKPDVKPGMSDEQVVAELGAYLARLSEKDLFSGTVLLAKAGAPLFFKSYGMANKDFAVPNTNETKFNIGSIDKVFTQVALQQLRDEGKVDFSKPLSTYLPDYPAAISGRITILQMLQHSSGLGDIFGPQYQAMPKNRLRTLQDFVPLFADKPLLFEPGSSRRYSNAAYVLLGLVIEKVSGMSYYDYVRTKIFEPLGMKDTGTFDGDAVVPGRAVGYMREDGPLRSNIYTLPAHASSAGGGYSTAMDLFRFGRGARKVLSDRAFKQMIGDDPGVGWAGGTAGVNAGVELTGPYTIVVLSNYDPPAAEEVSASIRKLLGRFEEE